MSFTKINATEFISLLASREPVPGGGGASALVGAVGVALGNMVGSLTVGKKKHAGVEGEIIELKCRADGLQGRLLRLVDEDAAAFLPLSKAYAIPKGDPGRESAMESALRVATATPLEIMRACSEAIEVIGGFAAKGSAIALSDAGAGALFCKAALQAASLNVFANTKYMADREYAASCDKEAGELLAEYAPLADSVFERVRGRE